MKAGDPVSRIFDVRPQSVDEGTGDEATAQKQARHHAAVPAKKARGLTDADPCGDPQEPRPTDGAGDPDVDREPDAAGADGGDPATNRLRLEAELADDVRRKRGFVVHRFDEFLVADEGVALRVARDPDCVEAATELANRGEQLECTRKPPGWFLHVAADDQCLAYPDLAQASQKLRQLSLVHDEASRQVGGDLKPAPRELLGELERPVDASGRRGGDRDLEVARDVRGDLFLDSFQREDL